MEPLHAFRTIELKIEMKDGSVSEVTVPFTLELMERVEETLFKAKDRPWWRIRPKDQTIRDALIQFCSFYLPSFDYMNADPTFPAVFFSRVREELNRSIENCMNSTSDTPA